MLTQRNTKRLRRWYRYKLRQKLRNFWYVIRWIPKIRSIDAVGVNEHRFQIRWPKPHFQQHMAFVSLLYRGFALWDRTALGVPETAPEAIDAGAEYIADKAAKISQEKFDRWARERA